jgi:hypothetical protein
LHFNTTFEADEHIEQSEMGWIAFVVVPDRGLLRRFRCRRH